MCLLLVSLGSSVSPSILGVRSWVMLYCLWEVLVVCYILLSFLDLTDAIFFYNVPFCLCTLPFLQVHCACVLCIERQFDGLF